MEICSTLQKSYIYLGWDEIECIVYCDKSKERLEIDYEVDKTIILEKSEEETNMIELLLMIKAVSANIEILIKEEINGGGRKKRCLILQRRI